MTKSCIETNDYMVIYCLFYAGDIEAIIIFYDSNINF